MLIPDNTYAVRNTYSHRFLSGLSEVDPVAAAIDASVGDGAATPTETTDWAKIGTAINSETLFLTNLFRQSQGKPPLPANTAPTVNVGVSDDTKRLIVGGGIALLIGALLLRAR